MIGIKLGDLPRVNSTNNDDLMIIQQRGGTKSVKLESLTSPINTKIDTLTVEIDKKQNAQSGMGLSQENYTSVEKTKVALIDNKLSKTEKLPVSQLEGKIVQSQISDELLSMITGNAPINAVPADNSISSVKIIDNAITVNKLGQLSGYVMGRGVIEIDTIKKTIKVPSNCWIVSEEGRFFKLSASDYNYSEVAGNYTVFVFFNSTTNLLELYASNTCPKNNGLMFITSIYSSLISHNTYGIKLNGSFLSLDSKDIVVDSEMIKSANLSINNLSDIRYSGGNLYNKDTVIVGKYVSATSGRLGDNVNYFASEFIKVNPGDKITTLYKDQIAMYDINLIFIKGLGNGVGVTHEPYTFIIPDNVYYIRLTIFKTYVNLLKVVVGEDTNVSLTNSIEIPKLIVKESNIDCSIDINRIDQIVKSNNLFNPLKAEKGKYVLFSSGDLSDNSEYYVSDFIPVEELQLYLMTHKDQLALYDINKKYITGIGNQTGNPFEVLIPKDARYIRISIYHSRLEDFQFVKGNIAPDKYENYKLKLGSEITQSILDTEECELENLFNQETVTMGYYVSFRTGELRENVDYFVSDFIEVKAGRDMTRSSKNQMACYDSNKLFIKGFGNSDPISFKTPINCKYIRVCDKITNLNNYQVEYGTISTTPKQYGTYRLKGLNVVENSNNNKIPEVICTLNEAWLQWKNNEKFPVGFLGDSTVDGVGCTGYVGHQNLDNAASGTGSIDYIFDKAYPYILETLIKKETGSSNPRIYNIGYSGTSTTWARNNMEKLFGSVYKDVKMVGLVHGINDRLNHKNAKEYETLIRGNFIYLINWLYGRGIQPFMVTTQASVEPGVMSSYTDSHVLRTSENINSVCNKVKKELAKEYNLEIIDLNSFGEKILTYSQELVSTIIPDTLHFADKGHELEAGFLFSNICPRTDIIQDRGSNILSFTSQKAVSDIPSEKTVFLSKITDGFKVKVKYNKTDTKDIKILDFWIFNDTKSQFNLESYIGAVNNKVYVKLDNVVTTLSYIKQTIGNLDIGLHHIEAYTGTTTDVDFIGFKLM